MLLDVFLHLGIVGIHIGKQLVIGTIDRRQKSFCYELRFDRSNVVLKHLTDSEREETAL